jgi:hypothetical protein
MHRVDSECMRILRAASIINLGLFLVASEAEALGAKKPDGDDPLCAEVRSNLREGDLIFLELSSPIFERVARASGGWASHVGIVLHDAKEGKLAVAESTIPEVKWTNLCKYIHHGKDSHFVVRRFKGSLKSEDIFEMRSKVEQWMGSLYHLGFKYDSRRQFCSKFVSQLYQHSIGLEVGRFETFRELLENIKGTKYEQGDMAFWRSWFLGKIPYKRRTVTPVSQVEDKRFFDIFYNPPKGDPSLSQRVASPSKWPPKQNTAAELEVDTSEL